MTTTAQSDPRALRRAIDDTRQHLADLINPVQRGVWRDEGTITRHIVPSLLQQLRRAVESSRASGGGPSKAAPIPISADAYDLLTSITQRAERMVKLWQASPDSNSVEDRLRAVVAVTGQSTDIEAVHGARLALAKWVHAIQSLLDPPKRLYLAAPCPRCEVSMVWRRNESLGEAVQQPALQVDGKTGCDCLACGAHWSPTLFEHLASVLGCPPVGGAA